MSKHPDKGWMVAEKAAGVCHNPRSSHVGSTVLTCLGKPALTIWTAVLIESSWMWLWGRGGGRTPFLLFLLYGRHCCEPWVYTVSSGSKRVQDLMCHQGLQLCLPVCSVTESWPALAIPCTVARCALLAWNFSHKNTGVGCHFFLQEIFPTQGLNPPLLCFLIYHCNFIYTYRVVEDRKYTRKNIWSFRLLLITYMQSTLFNDGLDEAQAGI